MVLKLMEKYPMLMSPVFKNIIWGGKKLREKYEKKADFINIAESWELTVRDDGMSVIANGDYSGMTLREYIKKDRTVLGSACNNEDFPLLIKFIDSGDDLSVQVHPSDTYARRHENQSGKTEMWYVVQAEENSQLIYGAISECTAGDLREAVTCKKLNEVLNRVNISAGDVYFIPSGQIHAICRGALIAEIQQNSNITYRLFDYNRVQNDGTKRELHIKKALECIKLYSEEEIRALRFEGRDGRRSAPAEADVLCDCKYFRVSKYCVGKRGIKDVCLNIDRTSFAALLFTDGEQGGVSGGGHITEVKPGDCVFVPAGIGEIRVDGTLDFLVCEL